MALEAGQSAGVQRQDHTLGRVWPHAQSPDGLWAGLPRNAAEGLALGIWVASASREI